MLDSEGYYVLNGYNLSLRRFIRIFGYFHEPFSGIMRSIRWKESNVRLFCPFERFWILFLIWGRLACT